MDWVSIAFGLSLGISVTWGVVGYLIWKRIDVLWEYARSLHDSDVAQMQLIDILAIHTGIDVRKQREDAMTLWREINAHKSDAILLRDKDGKLTEFKIPDAA